MGSGDSGPDRARGARGGPDGATVRSIGLALGLVAALGLSLPAAAEVTPAPGESVTFFHHDALGSPIAATDERGRLLWREAHEPFGRSLGRTDGEAGALGDANRAEEAARSETRTGYTGHVGDGGSQLVYMQQRHYDPLLGRFLSNDPIGPVPGEPHSFNRYAYANNNPYSFVDPDGRAVQAAAAAPVVGYAIYGYATLGLGVAASLNYGVNRTLGLLGLGPDTTMNSKKSDTEGEEDWEADYEEWANDNSDRDTSHGRERRENRNLDPDEARQRGERFRDTETGATVYVDGNKVAIYGEGGFMTGWSDQTEKQTSDKVSDGTWEPLD